MHGRPAGWLAVIPSHRMEDYYAYREPADKSESF
jgi:hypothetical protein